MGRGPRDKIKAVLSETDADAEAKIELRNGGKLPRQQRLKREAEKAEMDSFKLNRRAKF